MGAIEERLSPAHIEEHAGIQGAVVDQLEDAKAKIKDDLSQDFQEAKLLR